LNSNPHDNNLSRRQFRLSWKDRQRRVEIKLFRGVILTLSLFLTLGCKSLNLIAETQAQWAIVQEKSRVNLTMIADGLAFESHFTQIDGIIKWPSASAGGSHLLDLKIPIDSFSAGNEDAIELAMSDDFFDQKKFPNAHFVSRRVEQKGNRFLVIGKLTIKNISREIAVEVMFETTNNSAVLFGQTILKRLDYEIGVGEWADTDWLNNQVAVSFRLELKRD